jgi:hypothetical protein
MAKNYPVIYAVELKKFYEPGMIWQIIIEELIQRSLQR